MDKNENIRLWGDISKRYFESHVKQRFLFINYYILIFLAIVGSVGVILPMKLPEWFKIIYILLAWFSFTIITIAFWVFEERCKFLIKHGENTLIEIEKILDLPRKIRLFTKEKIITENKRKICWIYRYFSYSHCLRIMFITFYLISTICVFLYVSSALKINISIALVAN